MKMTKLVGIGLLVVLMSISVWAAGEEDLYGTWRLVSYAQEIPATGEKIDILAKPQLVFSVTAAMAHLRHTRQGRASEAH